MAKILRFEEPTATKPLFYRGLDTIPVFIVEEGGRSYDYFGFTNIPDELSAGRNLLALTGTKNLVPGSEIAIEVLDANGDLIPVKTFDHIGFGNKRVFSIEVGERVPEGDAVITVVGVSKGKVGYNAHSKKDLSELPPNNYRGKFNIRWQKRLNCYPRKRNNSELIFFPNPDITIDEIKRPYWKLNYNQDLATTPLNQATGSFCLTAPFTNSQEVRIDVNDGFVYRFIASSPTATPEDSPPVYFFGTGSSIAEDIVSLRNEINAANIGVITQTGSSTSCLGITSSAPGTIGNEYKVYSSSFSVLLNTASVCISHESLSLFRSQSEEVSRSLQSGSFYVGHSTTNKVRFVITGSGLHQGGNNVSSSVGGLQPTIYISSMSNSATMAAKIVSHFNFSSSLFTYSSSIGHMSASYEHEQLCFHSKIPSGSDGNNYVFQTTSSTATVHTLNLSGGVGHTHGPFSTSLQAQLQGGTTTLTSVNTGSEYSLVSTASISDHQNTNTSTKIKYEVQGDKYFLFCESNPDFGGFTDDMVGGTIFFPNPKGPFPSAHNGPYATPLYNELEDGDGNGVLDTGSGVSAYSNQGAYGTYIIERISPMQVRVNSPHTTMQGRGRANQKEVFHNKFDYSDFRLDWGQEPISKIDSLAAKDRKDANKKFYTSYAYVQFNNLTPLSGDITRIKTYIRNDQTANDYHLVGDNPVFSPELLVQSASLRERFPAGDFSAFGVSASLHTYWSASSSPGSSVAPPPLVGFKMNTSNLQNPIVESLQIGDTTPNSSAALTTSEYWVVECKTPILMRKDQYYQVTFESFALKTSNIQGGSPNLDVYISGPGVKPSDSIGKKIGTIEDVENVERIVYQDPLNFNKIDGQKFTFKADTTEFGYLKFKVNHGLWYLSNVSIKPYDHFGYTPHYFDTVIPTTKGNVGTKDALDFKFEFYNDDHRKAAYVADIKNVEFDNDFTFTATNVFFASASIDAFFGNTPIGDNDWIKEQSSSALFPHEQPETEHAIYHSGSVGIGDFTTTTVNYPLHIKKKQLEGNATIKAESYSSSILHLASDIGGSGPASRSAYILIDQNNASTASIIGYTDKDDKDPGGATMTGVGKGSFVIHERQGRVMSFGVGGTTPLQLATGISATFPAAGYGGVFVGHRNVNPGNFNYELDVSGSEIIRSGTLFLPDSAVTTSAGVNYFLGTKGPTGRVKKVELASIVGDLDWYIGSNYISQSRKIATTEGRTVVISDGPNVNSSIAPNTYIFQISQSGTTPRVQMLGIPSGSINRVLGLDHLGNLITSGSTKFGTGGSSTGSEDYDWYQTGSHNSLYLTSSKHVIVTGSISASGMIHATKLKIGIFEKDETRGIFGGDVSTIHGSLAVGQWDGAAMGVTEISGGAESLFVGAGNLCPSANSRLAMIGLNNSSSGCHGSIIAGGLNQHANANYGFSFGAGNSIFGADCSAAIGRYNSLSTTDCQVLIGEFLIGSASENGSVVVGRYNETSSLDAPFVVGGGSSGANRLNLLEMHVTHNQVRRSTTFTQSVGIGIYPSHPLDILCTPVDCDPVRIRNLNQGTGKIMRINTATGIVYYDSGNDTTPMPGPSDGPETLITNQEGALLLRNSPGIMLMSGSITFYSSSVTQSGYLPTSESIGRFATRSAIFKMEKDKDNDASFVLSGSGENKLYLSGSGKMGLGTTDPTNEIDIKADSFKIRSKDGVNEVEFTSDGTLRTRKFANVDDTTETTGSEVILSYSPGTFGSPTVAVAGDIMGAIRWQDESFDGTERTAGTPIKIEGKVNVATGAGIAGEINYFASDGENPDSAPIQVVSMKHQKVDITGSLSVTTDISSAGNISASGNITSSGLYVHGNISASGTITAPNFTGQIIALDMISCYISDADDGNWYQGRTQGLETGDWSGGTGISSTDPAAPNDEHALYARVLPVSMSTIGFRGGFRVGGGGGNVQVRIYTGSRANWDDASTLTLGFGGTGSATAGDGQNIVALDIPEFTLGSGCDTVHFYVGTSEDSKAIRGTGTLFGRT